MQVSPDPLRYTWGRLISLLSDRQPPLKESNPDKPVTVLVAAYNEARNIAMTLRYIARQDYRGPVKVVLADNGSTDGIAEVAQRAAMELDLPLQVMHEARRETPKVWKHLSRQRACWARGMLEAIGTVGPWKQPRLQAKFLTGGFGGSVG